MDEGNWENGWGWMMVVVMGCVYISTSLLSDENDNDFIADDRWSQAIRDARAQQEVPPWLFWRPPRLDCQLSRLAIPSSNPTRLAPRPLHKYLINTKATKTMEVVLNIYNKQTNKRLSSARCRACASCLSSQLVGCKHQTSWLHAHQPEK